MKNNKMLRILLLLAVLTAGAWMLGRPGALQPEGAARVRALRSLSAGSAATSAGANVAAQEGVGTGATVVHEAVTPGVVDFSKVQVSTENENSMYARWMRGELDLEENDGILSAAEMLELQQAALALRPDASVQQAVSVGETSGPQPLAPTLGISWDAIDYTHSGQFVPPDPELAVGPNHMIAVVNVAVAIYDKSGTALLGPTVAGPLYSDPTCSLGQLYDPNVVYDEEADRWILAYDMGPGSATGGWCVLVSQTGDPMGLWYEYFFQLNDLSGWMDYPHTGVGDNYIVMGGNIFAVFGNAFVEGRIYAFDKADLYAGNPVTTIERGLGVIDGGPQPLRLHGYSSGTWPAFGNDHYFVTDPFNGQTYGLYKWNPATDTLTSIDTFDLGAGGFPVNVPQNGAGLMQANDWRLLDFEYRNGYGWVVQTVSCNPGGGTVNCVRWAQLDLSDGSFGPAGTGTYASNGQHRFFPDLAVNHCDDMAVGYTRSSSSTFPSIWVTGRESTDSNGVLQAEIELKAGEIAYTAFDPSPRRWGDYTGMTIDPDGETFWYLGQYSKITNHPNGRWATYIGSFTFAGCNSSLAQIEVDPASLASTQPADTVITDTLTIENVGSDPLNWTVVESLPWLSVVPDAGTTGAASSTGLDVVFDSTGLASGVYSGVLTVNSNDTATPTVNVPVQLTVEGYGVQLGADQAQNGAPGETVTYTVAITNSGSLADTYDLSVSGATWTATASQSSISLAAGASATFTVEVQIAGAAGDGDSDSATVTATSQGDGTVSDAVQLTTTAEVAPETWDVYLPVFMRP